MRLYLHSTTAEKSKSYPMHLAPAADALFVPDGDMPNSWTNADSTAKQISIEFVYGVVEVPDELGRYMVARGIAHKSRLLRKISQLFDRNGEPIEEVFDKYGQRINLDTPVLA